MRAATAGVCSAGLAATALPATSAAATWPVKIASGKFHGLMQTKTPRPCRRSSLLSPVGPGSAVGAQRALGLVGVVAAEVDRLAHLGDAVAQRLARLRHEQAAELGQARLERVGGARAAWRARSPTRRAFQAAKAAVQPRPSRPSTSAALASAHRVDACVASTRALERLALGHARRGRRRASCAAAGVAGSVEIDRQRQRRRRRRRASGEASRASTSTAASASWCTNEELAPFSSSRRTR